MKFLKYFLHRFLIICFFSLSVILEASAETYYVSPFGRDSDPGTASKPFKTIQKGVNVLEAGDTVIVRDGIYSNFSGTPTKTVNIGVRGTPENWITIKSENKWGAVLDGQGTIAKGFNFNKNVDYVRIEDFEVRNYTLNAISINQGYISNIYIYGNNLHHIGGHSALDTNKGTTEVDAAQYITIDSNIIHDIGRPESSGGPFSKDHGLYLRGIHHTIINNIFYNNKSGWSIHLSGHNRDLKDFHHYIANNTIIADSHEYRGGRFGGILVRVSSVWIENNIIIVPKGKETIGGAINVYSEGLECEKNIVVRNNLTNADNILSDHDDKREHLCPGELISSGNQVKSNPLFVGESMPSSDPNDYKLQLSSRAIDAGLKIVLSNDFAGTNRPQGSGHDIGAFEYKKFPGNYIREPQKFKILAVTN
ncbi:MAG: DUF1565 domain-containing protein [Candidatus Scalindua sp. AMX11]|nr:DUF1565 domain-containing protein [Planctomycetota bacterium]RZV60628.1 MAG: DUF1565 domain-containing protein [Candidatus Scalindua sp. SCAELEC01]TDE63125.1 MAG: DUF1565 domain-containing protein [Candidatus Scalindua sp. AMX11]GJQ57594.1 MAG: hypothetical protein SCALA701_03950 [Candidatus Scalindua sp.]